MTTEQCHYKQGCFNYFTTTNGKILIERKAFRFQKVGENETETGRWMEIKTSRKSEFGLRGTNLGAVAKDHQSTDNEDKHELK